MFAGRFRKKVLSFITRTDKNLAQLLKGGGGSRGAIDSLTFEGVRLPLTDDEGLKEIETLLSGNEEK